MKPAKIAAAIAAMVIILTVTACQSDTSSGLDDLSVGQENVQFGPYSWEVLDVQDGKALLITEDILEMIRFNEEYEAIVWADSSIRKYLNEDFYNENFSDEEKSKIIEVTNSTPDNEWFGTEGGPDTQDKIFLLSIEEVVRYYGDSGQLENGNPDSSYSIEDEYGKARIAQFEDANERWWLRSPGIEPEFTAMVARCGMLEVGGYFAEKREGLRPALWITLD